MIGLDTNILVRYFAEDDPRQSKAARQLIENRLSKEQPGFISAIVLAELIWVLTRAYSSPKEVIGSIVEGMLASPALVVEHKTEVRQALADFQRMAVGFADCLIARINAAAGCKVTYTFDRSAAKLAGNALL